MPTKHRAWAVLAVALVLLCASGALAKTKAIAPGEKLPDVPLQAPTVKSTLAYLGLPEATKQFRLSQIKAKVVVVEVFNMY